MSKYKVHNERQQEILKQISAKQKHAQVLPRIISEVPEDNGTTEEEMLAFLKQSKYKDRPNSSKMSSRKW